MIDRDPKPIIAGGLLVVGFIIMILLSLFTDPATLVRIFTGH